MYVCVYVGVCMCMYVYVYMYSTYTYFTSHPAQRKKISVISNPAFWPKACNDRMYCFIVAKQPFLLLIPSIPDLVIIAVTNCTVNCYDPGLPSSMQADVALFIFSPTWTFPPIRLSLPHLKTFQRWLPSPLHHISKANEPCPTKQKNLAPSHDQKKGV